MSWTAQARANRALTLEERLWQKVAKGAGCWEWQGAKTSAGRGVLQVDGHPMYATRIVLSWTLGRPLQSGELACHTCDNPICVRPDHLFVGSTMDNRRDMLAKGRERPKRWSDAERAAISQRQRLHWASHTPPESLKTHCPQGHPYDEANTYWTGRKRHCRTCSLASQRRYRERRKR